MTSAEKPLAELVQELPPDLQSQVRQFVTQLLQLQDTRMAQPLRQDWAGALRDLRDHTTSVELQHRSVDWMIEGVLNHSGTDVSR